MSVNRKQRIVLLVSALLILFCFVFTPWDERRAGSTVRISTHYYPIISLPERDGYREYRLNWFLVAAAMASVTLACGMLFVFFFSARNLTIGTPEPMKPHKVDPDGEWLEINALSNATDYLRKATQALRGSDDAMKWKWVVAGVASGLYGLLVCALEGSDGTGVIDYSGMDKAKREEMNTLFRAGENGDTEAYVRALDIEDEFLRSKGAKLISFQEALSRAGSTEHMDRSTAPNAGPIDLTEKQVQHILHLWREYRNNFEHFRPIHRAIQVRVLHPLVRDAIVAICQLVRNAAIWMEYWAEVQEARQVADELRSAFEKACKQ